MQPGAVTPQLPEARTCAICGVTREDVAEVSYHYGETKERRVQAMCADCKARYLVRKRKSRRQRISRGNRAAEIMGMVLVGAGVLALAVVILGAVATNLF